MCPDLTKSGEDTGLPGRWQVSSGDKVCPQEASGNSPRCIILKNKIGSHGRLSLPPSDSTPSIPRRSWADPQAILPGQRWPGLHLDPDTHRTDSVFSISFSLLLSHLLSYRSMWLLLSQPGISWPCERPVTQKDNGREAPSPQMSSSGLILIGILSGKTWNGSKQ